MQTTEEKICWAGLDWGGEKHAVCVVDDAGEPRDAFDAPHTVEGLETLAARLRQHPGLAGVAVETSRGLAITKLLAVGLAVYPVNPKVAKAWRDGWKAASPKSDAFDALVLADGLRHRRALLRPLAPGDVRARELALLCADEVRLIQERTALVNQLRAALKEYHPTALEWFSDWTSPAAWDFVLMFPGPEALAGASRKRLFGFLKTHGIGLTPKWEERVRLVKDAVRWPQDPAAAGAKQFLAQALARQLRTLEASLREYRDRIESAFDDHPDAGLFASLPGAGPKLAPRLLASFDGRRGECDSAESFQKISGVVPVTRRSGKQYHVMFRRACDKRFRASLHKFAECSIRFCPWAAAFYQQATAKGQSHALAVRNLAAKWVKIIFRMMTENTPYDESRYLASLARHNSPLLTHPAFVERM